MDASGCAHGSGNTDASAQPARNNDGNKNAKEQADFVDMAILYVKWFETGWICALFMVLPILS